MISDTTYNHCPLARFVEQVTSGCSVRANLTVNHLRSGLRQERMSEFTDWSNCELDSIELHAAKFAGEMPLNAVFEVPFDREPGDVAHLVSNLCAPSPFAWT